MQITGTLKQARKEQWGKHTIVIGKVYGDIKGRFKDGHTIHTSSVQRFEGDLAITRNSVYKVEWAPVKPGYDELVSLLADNQEAWEGEEDSVKEEHAELIAKNEAMLNLIREAA